MTKTAKAKMLVVGYGDRVSGFARVVHNIVETLVDSFEIVHFAPNLHSPPSRPYPWKMYANERQGDFMGLYSLDQLISSFRPDVVWLLNDYWWLATYSPLLLKYRHQCKFIAYLPLDGAIVKAGPLEALQYYDMVVVYTEFARREITTWLNGFQLEYPEFQPPPITVIPHGVDLNTFHQLSVSDSASHAEARKVLFNELDPDAFWVMNGNQNSPRKRLDITLEGFAKFAHKKPSGVKLVLPFTFETRYLKSRSINVPLRAAELGISDRIIYRVRSADDVQLSDEHLNELYNCCDVGINTSWAEGWGMISFEHAATAAAQIVCNHTACAELWEGYGDLMETHPIEFGQNAMLEGRGPNAILEGRVPNASCVAALLERHYQDRAYSFEMSRKALSNAMLPQYRWERIGREWQETIEYVLVND